MNTLLAVGLCTLIYYFYGSPFHPVVKLAVRCSGGSERDIDCVGNYELYKERLVA